MEVASRMRCHCTYENRRRGVGAPLWFTAYLGGKRSGRFKSPRHQIGRDLNTIRTDAITI